MAGSLFAAAALLPDGWASNVLFTFGADGVLTGVDVGAAQGNAPRAEGPVLPGMPDVHAHAFQRLLIGRTQRTRGGDDFWSWRRSMFAAVGALDPEAQEAVAAQLYTELLCHGYTSVGEFHYVHAQADGTPYADTAAMALAVAQGARQAGIALTLLPVMYRRAGFDGGPLAGHQRAFGLRPDDFGRVVARLRSEPGVRVGLAPHSLRAVTLSDLRELVDLALPGDPVHVHVSEQPAEVDACLVTHGCRPVDLLMDHAPVDASWCLIHATHADASERARIVASRAVVGLCPSTEGDLGDGFFPLTDFAGGGGHVGIGSDSNVARSPGEEIRLLVYQARGQARRRHVGAENGTMATAHWADFARHGARAIARPAGQLEPGRLADLVVLDAGSDLLYGLDPDAAAAAFILSGGPGSIARVLVAGRTVVEGTEPVNGSAIRANWVRTIDRLRARWA